MDEGIKRGAEVLATLMARRGLSAPQVAAQTNGAAAPSTVRSYAAGRSAPRPSKALAVARVFGADAGGELLRAWGLSELAEGLREEVNEERLEREFPPAPAAPPVEATVNGPVPGSPSVGSRVTLTILGTAETTGGGSVWIARGDSGTLLAVIPLRSVEGLSS